MKRILSSLFVIALLVAFVSPAMAESFSSENTEKLILLNTDTGLGMKTAIPTSASGDRVYIQPGKHRIIQVVVTNLAALHTENVVAIYDASGVGTAGNKQCEGEIESADEDTIKMKWARPLKLVNGLVVIQGSGTSVTIEFEKYRP